MRGESRTRTDSHKSSKRHKLDKRQPLLKGSKYKRYTPLTVNRAVILEEVFNAKIPTQLPFIPPPRLGLDRTKQYRYRRNHDHNTEDCWILEEKIEELIQIEYLAHFLKKLDGSRTRCLGGTRTTIIGYEMPTERAIERKKEEDRGVISKDTSVNLSKSKRTNPLSRLEV